MQLAANGISMHVEDRGAGPTALFVHGFPLSGRMWQPTIDRLQRSLRCIAPDLRGHGRSDASAQASIELFADDLASLLVALRIDRPVVVVGLSMGGMIALDFFRRYRPRVRALALCDTRANAESPEGKVRRKTMADAALRDGSRAVADRMIETILAPSAAPTLRQDVHAMMCATPPQGVAAAALALAERPDSEPTLPLIDCPTLVVAGEQDALTPPDYMRYMSGQIPGARFEIIPGAGHLPPMEQPDGFAGVLHTFIDQIDLAVN